MKRPNTIVTFDPGVSNGGICLWRRGEPVKAVRLEADLTKINGFIEHVSHVDPDALFFVEAVSSRPTDHNIPGKAWQIQKMTDNYAQIKAFITYHGFRYVPVYPQSWQATLGLRKNTKGMEDKDRKNYYKQYAQNCFPEIKATLWNSDALCLVQFALSKFESDPSWIKERVKNEKSGLF